MKYNYLSHFLNTDHFGSATRLSQISLRQIAVTFPVKGSKQSTYKDFERGIPVSNRVKRRFQRRRKSPVIGDREQLTSLLDLSHLMHVTINLALEHNSGKEHYEYRNIVPVVKTLKFRGVRVQVLEHDKRWGTVYLDTVDVSDLFDNPSENDGNAFGKKSFGQLAQCEMRGILWPLSVRSGFWARKRTDYREETRRPSRPT
jgi:hypothetical protein